MIEYNIIWLIITGVILFLFSLEKFTNDVQRAGGEKFKNFIKKITSSPAKGTLAGAIVTGIIQSSAATVVIITGLVHSGTINFFNSLGVIFGANIGTTITAQLVAFKLTAIAPAFIIIGFAIRFLGPRYRLLGKAVFYFGLVFFSLNLVAQYVEPISKSQEAINFFSNIDNIFLAILAGMVFTVFVQSSSITTGLVVILVGTQLLDFTNALGIIFGANIGSTSTAMLASIKLNTDAKRTALAHLMFNVLGIVVILPFLNQFTQLIQSFGGSEQQMVANAHLIFNVSVAIIFLFFVKPFHKLICKILPEKATNLNNKKTKNK